MRNVLKAIRAVFSRPEPPAAAPAVPASPQDGGRRRTIRAALPADRLLNGTLTVEDEDGRTVLGPHPVVCTVVTLVVADSPQRAASLPPQPRQAPPSGPFPRRPEAAAHSPALEQLRRNTTTDSTDGFLLSYAIGWPVNATPGSIVGTLLHTEERRHDDSAERFRASDIPVLRDDGQNPQDPSKGAEGQSNGAAEAPPESPARVGSGHEAPVPATGAPTADTPPPASGATSHHYTPSGGAYDR